MNESTLMTVVTWIGIGVCISQSALFSGLNLATFGVSRLRLEVEKSTGNPDAAVVLALREDSNFLLTTILWGNVGVNCLLTLLSGSVLSGVLAFLFSTVFITMVGEILPQAYFSRNALRIAAALTPWLRFYQRVLYPVARPSAKLLDWWLGFESARYLGEHDLRHLIKKHIDAAEAEIDRLEGMGAMNFLTLDDLTVSQEGETIHPESILSLPTQVDLPILPEFGRDNDDPFLRKLQASGKKWVVLADLDGRPRLVLDADGFLRAALLGGPEFQPYRYCHRPVVVSNPKTLLGSVILRLKVQPERDGDDVVDHDVILVWGNEKRIITGTDILGRLLRGIVRPAPWANVPT